MDDKEIIKSIKSKLKEEGFICKGTFYCKIKCDKIFSVQFQKRLDGFNNINLGILYGTNINLVSNKNMDIGWMFRNHDNNYYEAIMRWFDERDSIDQVKNLFWSGKLGDFISDKCERMIKGTDGIDD